MQTRELLTILYFFLTIYSFSGGAVQVIIAAVLNLFIWIITATMAIPIHKQLDRAKSNELIDRLVAIHVYLRLIPGLILMVVSAAMMYQAFTRSL